VLTIDNIWMYRQLAGGLTTAHVMHGSANPIGGQNQHVKMRWGALPEQLKFEGAPRTVKFALGENVVRSPNRYPNTRMGVEQIIRDHFLAAREYERAHQAWQRNRPGRAAAHRPAHAGAGGHPERRHPRHVPRVPPGRDAHAHAPGRGVRLPHPRVPPRRGGVQDRAGARRHGAAAVVWSDWGAFKVEAFDNTTYNARILHDAGVLTSLHSDDSQIATRMNWEAAKMLRTGISEEDALALVTINTAKVLGHRQPRRLAGARQGCRLRHLERQPALHGDACRADLDRRTPLLRPERGPQLREQAERERSQLIQSIMNAALTGDSTNDDHDRNRRMATSPAALCAGVLILLGAAAPRWRRRSPRRGRTGPSPSPAAPSTP
jgi:hypothetical protein